MKKKNSIDHLLEARKKRMLRVTGWHPGDMLVCDGRTQMCCCHNDVWHWYAFEPGSSFIIVGSYVADVPDNNLTYILTAKYGVVCVETFKLGWNSLLRFVPHRHRYVNEPQSGRPGDVEVPVREYVTLQRPA